MSFTLDLQNKTNKELKEFCKQNNIKGITGKNKDGLLSLIREAFEEKQKQLLEKEKFWKNSENPSQVSDVYWLFWRDINKHYNSGDGKWMLFFHRNQIDSEWKKYTKLWEESKLPGVLSMKVSTALDNPRASNKEDHVLILYCAGDENNIMTTGQNIVSHLENYKTPYIYYKSNIQTHEGTRATGQTKNYTFRISTKTDKSIQDSTYRIGGLSRREQKNSIKEGYCGCGRKEVEGETGCSRWPSCVNGSSDEESWY